MGSKPYSKLENFDLAVDQNNIVLEIGSERGEGSSSWLYAWAKQRNIEFYSVDVEHHTHREQTYPEINWIVTSSGSDWCKTSLPGLNKKIKVLYLDNFDWIWEPKNIPDWIQEQIDSYARRGVTMNNQNCQEEHRLQLEYCLPYLDEQSVVIMDDTYYEHGNKSQLRGKCATAIPLLLANGFKIDDSAEYATRGCK
jgi:hypothetical protein